MRQVDFNRRPIVQGGGIEQPPQELVKNTPGLWRASIQDAVTYGGDLTREALSAICLKNDRKYVCVDVKVHMLMHGMFPAIPGWHTDGIPRPNGLPDLREQERLDDRFSRFHLLVTGHNCLTKFLLGPRSMDLPEEPSKDLYTEVTKQVKPTEIFKDIPSCVVWEWDWWQLHSGIASTGFEWRYLIRVTESDDTPPNKDLREVLRSQQQVYLPLEYGW